MRDLICLGFYGYKFGTYKTQQGKPFFISGKNKRTKKRKLK